MTAKEQITKQVAEERGIKLTDAQVVRHAALIERNRDEGVSFHEEAEEYFNN